MKEQAAEAILRARDILVISHEDPDGDAIGSILGFTWALRQLGKRVYPACPDPVPSTYQFLPGSDEIAAISATDQDLIVTLDGSDKTRFGDCFDLEQTRDILVVNIDHHVTNTHFADINWVGPSYSATCEMIVDLLPSLGVTTDARIATCLLTGALTDTLGFRTRTTSPHALRIAAQLVEEGAPLAEITDQVFNRRAMSSLRLWGKVIEGMQFDDGLVWASSTIAIRRDCGVDRMATNGVVNLLATVREAHVAVLFTERETGEVEVSLRSRPGYNVAAVALRLGGGGHPQAAGCRLYGPLEAAQDRVLSELKASLGGRLS